MRTPTLRAAQASGLRLSESQAGHPFKHRDVVCGGELLEQKALHSGHHGLDHPCVVRIPMGGIEPVWVWSSELSEQDGS